MMRHWIGAAACLGALFLTGCGNVAISHVPYQSEPRQKKLAVFLDGTANDEGSHTNISKLHNLVRLQSDVGISTTYIKGVGVEGKVIGMAMGWGIGEDVRQAYRYLAENYSHERKDEIYIFGFSRGAFAARILAALIHVAGIPDVSKMKKEKDRIEFIEEIYDAYKSDGMKSINELRKNVLLILRNSYKPVRIKFMGLWDTVEALGFPDYKENVGLPNPRYSDQLCNVDKAAHAVAIDDDRARIFTPILLTRQHLIKECMKLDINKVVTEVWFSGAHSDVGGGYKDTQISGVSLNWMIGQIRDADDRKGSADTAKSPVKYLLPTGAAVYSDFGGKTHDPEGGIWGLIYHKRNRNLARYTENKKYLGGKLKIHQSVVDRLAMCKVQPHESKWHKEGKYKVCFTPTDGVFKFNGEDKSCAELIEVVDQKYQDFGIAQCGNDKEDPEKN